MQTVITFEITPVKFRNIPIQNSPLKGAENNKESSKVAVAQGCIEPHTCKITW